MKTSRKIAVRRVPLSEREVVDGVTLLLAAERYRVRHEVPNMGQSADVVATRGGWVTFIEAKVGNWRRAVAQCLAHEQVADFICLAIGAASVPEQLLAVVESRGYGLISCRPSDLLCTWIRRPRRNPKVWAPQRRRVAALMRKIRHAC